MNLHHHRLHSLQTQKCSPKDGNTATRITTVFTPASTYREKPRLLRVKKPLTSATGNVTFVEQYTKRMISKGYTNAGQPKLTARSSTEITPRELDVLKLLAAGLRPRDVADRLHISPDTVKAHLRNIYKKTGSQNKIEALNKTRWLTASPLATRTNC